MVMGDEDFDEVFRAHFGRLVALGVSMTGSVDVARDLAQETMLRAHDRWDTLRGYEAPEAWLRRVMSNLLIDEHRKRQTERATLERLRADQTPAVDGPESSAQRWSELVAPLTERQRLVATLYYVDDQSVGQIADALEISTGTVKSTLAKARRQLERRLDVVPDTTQEGDGHG